MSKNGAKAARNFPGIYIPDCPHLILRRDNSSVIFTKTWPNIATLTGCYFMTMVFCRILKTSQHQQWMLRTMYGGCRLNLKKFTLAVSYACSGPNIKLNILASSPI